MDHQQPKKKRVLQQLEDMFGSVFDWNVIHSVAQHCRWNLHMSAEKLMVMSEDITRGEQSRQPSNNSSSPSVKGFDHHFASQKKLVSDPKNLKGNKSAVAAKPNLVHPAQAMSRNVFTAASLFHCKTSDSLSSVKVAYQGLHCTEDLDDADIVVEEETEFEMIGNYRFEVGRIACGAECSALPVDLPLHLHNHHKNLPVSAMKQKFDHPKTCKINKADIENENSLIKIRTHIHSGTRILILMRGVPGSGKSYLARHLVQTCVKGHYREYVFSADDYFTTGNGQYIFDPARLSQAHEWVHRNVENKMKKGESPIIVDNTNIQLWEMQPYAILAVDYGYVLELLEPLTSWRYVENKLSERNIHGVPRHKIRMMLQRFEPQHSGRSVLRLLNLSYHPARRPPQPAARSSLAARIIERKITQEGVHKRKHRKNGFCTPELKDCDNGSKLVPQKRNELSDMLTLYVTKKHRDQGKTLDPKMCNSKLSSGLGIRDVPTAYSGINEVEGKSKSQARLLTALMCGKTEVSTREGAEGNVREPDVLFGLLGPGGDSLVGSESSEISSDSNSDVCSLEQGGTDLDEELLLPTEAENILATVSDSNVDDDDDEALENVWKCVVVSRGTNSPNASTEVVKSAPSIVGAATVESHVLNYTSAVSSNIASCASQASSLSSFDKTITSACSDPLQNRSKCTYLPQLTCDFTHVPSMYNAQSYGPERLAAGDEFRTIFSDLPCVTGACSDVPLASVACSDVLTVTVECNDLPPVSTACSDVLLVSTAHSDVLPVSTAHSDVLPVSTAHSDASLVSTSHSDAPLVSTAHSDVPLVSTAHSDAPLVSTSHSDAPLVSVACSDAPLVSVACSDAPLVSVSCSDVPLVSATCSDVPLVSATCSDVPLVSATCSDVPLVSATCSDAPLVSTAHSDAPLVSVACSDAPLVSTAHSDVPLVSVSCSDAPLVSATCSDVLLVSTAHSDVPLVSTAHSDVPLVSTAHSDAPLVSVACSDAPLISTAHSDVPLVSVSCSDAPLVSATCSDVLLVSTAHSDVPLVSTAHSDVPLVSTAHSDVPLVSTAHSDVPLVSTAHSDVPLVSTAHSDAPLVSTSHSDAPLVHTAHSDAPLVSVACSDAPLVSTAHSDAPLVSATCSDAPLVSTANSDAPVVSTACSDMSQIGAISKTNIVSEVSAASSACVVDRIVNGTSKLPPGSSGTVRRQSNYWSGALVACVCGEMNNMVELHRSEGSNCAAVGCRDVWSMQSVTVPCSSLARFVESDDKRDHDLALATESAAVVVQSSQVPSDSARCITNEHMDAQIGQLQQGALCSTLPHFPASGEARTSLEHLLEVAPSVSWGISAPDPDGCGGMNDRMVLEFLYLKDEVKEAGAVSGVLSTGCSGAEEPAQEGRESSAAAGEGDTVQDGAVPQVTGSNVWDLGEDEVAQLVSGGESAAVPQVTGSDVWDLGEDEVAQLVSGAESAAVPQVTGSNVWDLGEDEVAQLVSGEESAAVPQVTGSDVWDLGEDEVAQLVSGGESAAVPQVTGSDVWDLGEDEVAQLVSGGESAAVPQVTGSDVWDLGEDEVAQLVSGGESAAVPQVTGSDVWDLGEDEVAQLVSGGESAAVPQVTGSDVWDLGEDEVAQLVSGGESAAVPQVTGSDVWDLGEDEVAQLVSGGESAAVPQVTGSDGWNLGDGEVARLVSGAESGAVPKPARITKRKRGPTRPIVDRDAESCHLAPGPDAGTCDWQPVTDADVSWQLECGPDFVSLDTLLSSHEPLPRPQRDIFITDNITDYVLPKLRELDLVSNRSDESGIANFPSVREIDKNDDDADCLREQDAAMFSESSTNTHHTDFWLARLVERNNDSEEMWELCGMQVVASSGQCEMVSSPSPALMSARTAGSVLMLDKSSMTGEDNALADAVAVGQNFEQLFRAFGHVPRDQLKELFDKCKGDVNWAAEVLLDSGYEPRDDACRSDISAGDDADYGHRVQAGHAPEVVAAEQFLPPVVESTTKMVETKARAGKKSGKNTLKDLPCAECLELKKHFERNIRFDMSHYSEHVQQLKRQRHGDPDLQGELAPAPEELLTNEADRSATAMVPPAGDVDQASDDEETVWLPLVLERQFVRTLHQLFGSLAAHCPADVDDGSAVKVQIPLSLARQLYCCLVDAQHSQLDKQDEELARRLQEEEQQAGASKVAGLQEIMDMELALALYRADLDKDSSRRESTEDMATRLSRLKLAEMFPLVEESVLSEVFSAHNCSFTETCEVLQASTSSVADDVVLDVFSPEALARYERQLLDQAQLETSKDLELEKAQDRCEEDSDRVLDAKQQALEDCNNLRAEAARHAELRRECSRKALQAHSNKLYAVSTYYSRMAELHRRRVDRANEEAASLLLTYHADCHWNTTLDLHFLRVSEATQVLDMFLDAHVANLQEHGQHARTLYIITGRGAHSAGGRARLRPAVMRRLVDRGVRFHRADNPGVLTVSVNRHTPLSSSVQP